MWNQSNKQIEGNEVSFLYTQLSSLKLEVLSEKVD